MPSDFSEKIFLLKVIQMQRFKESDTHHQNKKTACILFSFSSHLLTYIIK